MEPGDDWQLTERVRASAHRSGKGDPFAAAVRATRMAMIITDPRRPDNPIVFANDAFLALTGYTRLEVTGRNCRFLQGPETDMHEVARVRAAIAAERDVHAELLNYRKDGTTFHNALFLSAVHDEDGTLLFFFASQLDVSDRYALRDERDRTQAALDANALLLREVGHRARNDLQMISAMLVHQSGDSTDPAVRAALEIAIGRIDALAALYRMPQGEHEARDLAELTREVAGTLVEATGRDDVALTLDLVPVPIRADAAGPLALILSESVSNALRHAFPDRPGRVAVHLARDGAAVVLGVADDGVGLPEPSGEHGSAGRGLVDVLVRQLDGARSVEPEPTGGTRIVFRFPAERIGA
ncbi:MAG: PAS domain-containing protein [Methylorubrum rhodinum]|uniref:PAS domain-containing protein n=1 Tax=Methylorubrum rhodinum TaxID=29428 RepID=UPI003BB0FD59